MLEKQKLTPMMQQYLQIKQEHQDAILFYRLGDFYEMFFEDAIQASKILDIALTSRNKNEGSSVPLCGVPYHAASSYIRRLIDQGLKVAICEQVEDPKQAKGIVRREVTRVITPGLLVEEDSLHSLSPNYLVSLVVTESEVHAFFLDISTGEILQAFYEHQDTVVQDLRKHQVREILLTHVGTESLLRKKIQACLPHVLISGGADLADTDLEKDIYSQDFLDSKKLILEPDSLKALNQLLTYVRKTQKSILKHLGSIQVIRKRQLMGIDARTFRHLELTQSLRGEGRQGTLFSVLNKTGSSMGARRLKKWIQYPLLDIVEIAQRQDAIGELLENPQLLFDLNESIRKIQDIERMLGKLALHTVNARDLWNLAYSLKIADGLIQKIRPRLSSPYFVAQLKRYPDLEDLYHTLLSNLLPELPATVREGGMIAQGIHSELDELRHISSEGKTIIAKMEEEEKRDTRIASLKIRYNRVFGYYIEVTHTQRHLVPDHYIRKQTLANAERYITPRLKEYESKVLGAEERIKAIEYEIFCSLRDRSAKRIEDLRVVSEVLSILDVLSSLSQAAKEYGYVRPELCEESTLDLQDSRHPVLDLELKNRFIPNDIQMGEEKERLFLITGPNMAGKSTVMRQVALIVLMAQMGSFVPAKKARIGIVDQVFTRVGASDDLLQGQSTFMVEMLETADILKSATQRSLIILDEIGRGTSTYDGISIAWSVAEYVAEKIKCRTLFATHYHELTSLAETCPSVANYQVAVKEWNDQIIFLHRLIQGGASRSYGIEVARLAGLSDEIILRAKEVLKSLENAEDQALRGIFVSPSSPVAPSTSNQDQLPLFDPCQKAHLS